MDTSGCISNNIWLDYAAGRLGDKDKDLLIRHTATCEVCADIREGVDAMKEPATLARRVDDINAEAQRNASPVYRKPVKPSWYLAVAAAFIIATGLGWFALNKQPENNIALHEKPAGMQEQVIIPGQEPAGKGKEPASSSGPVNRIPTGRKERAQHHVITAEAHKPVQAESKDRDTGKEIQPAFVHTDAKIATLKKSKTGEEEQVLSEEDATIRAQDLIFSDNLVTSDLFHNSTDDSVAYSRSLTLYNIAAYDSCRSALFPLIRNNRSAYHESGLLLIAKTYMAENNKTMAKQYLDNVIRIKGRKAAEAEGLLIQLNRK